MKSPKKKQKRVEFENLTFPTYEELISDIQKRAGKRSSMPVDLPPGSWTEQSVKVLSERYLRKDERGHIIETPSEMCWRVAWDIASAEVRWGKDRKEVIKTAKQFYKLLVTHEFLPNSPTLMNAGTGNGLQYSACFVLPVGDSLVEIFDAIKYQALIHQTGGGTGFSFSRLRPHGAMVKSSRGTASGPVSFMRIFDAATNEIKQGGKRRGANMGILRVDHPDIVEFIHCKEEGGITNFNISVAITDEFMDAVRNDTDYNLYAPKTDIRGSSRKVVGTLSATKVWDEIAQGAWRTGDPGLIFIDRVNDDTANPVPSLGPVESTNPCGEQPLYPYDSCNLGSIFLNYFVIERNGRKEVDWEKLAKVSRLSVRFLDDVIEMNPYPLEQIRRTSLAIRRIGLGVGGWADMLIDLEIPYDSDEAIKLGEKIMKVIKEEAVTSSRSLARERGAFPMWPVSIYKNEEPRRNSTVTTIAPTGSISIIAGSSSGIEPLFAVAFQHIVKDKHLDRTLTFINPKFEEVAKDEGFWSEKIKEKIAEHGVVREIEEIPEKVRKVFGTAHEIHHDWHIKHQSAFQKYTENAVSKTINMENSVTADSIKEAYMLAWETNCKGVTVFRDGCKNAQVLNIGVKGEEAVQGQGRTEEKISWSRPVKILGSTYKIKTPVGTAFITVNQDEVDNPVEVFINIGKAGTDVQAMAEALGRLISKSLNFGNNLTSRDRALTIIDQLRGIGGRRSVGFGQNKVLSLPDAIAMALSWHLGISNGIENANDNGVKKDDNNVHESNSNGHTNGNTTLPVNGHTGNGVSNGVVVRVALGNTADDTTELSPNEAVSQEALSIDGYHFTHNSPKGGDLCPSCGATSLVYQEGCMKCYSCGHSEC